MEIKQLPKWFHYTFLCIFLVIIGMLILFGILKQPGIITMVIFLPLAIISMIGIVYLIAKKYEKKSLIIPIILILDFLLATIISITLPNNIIQFVHWIVSIAGICIVLYFIWKE